MALDKQKLHIVIGFNLLFHTLYQIKQIYCEVKEAYLTFRGLTFV